MLSCRSSLLAVPQAADIQRRGKRTALDMSDEAGKGRTVVISNFTPSAAATLRRVGAANFVFTAGTLHTQVGSLSYGPAAGVWTGAALGWDFWAY